MSKKHGVPIFDSIVVVVCSCVLVLADTQEGVAAVDGLQPKQNVNKPEIPNTNKVKNVCLNTDFRIILNLQLITFSSHLKI